MVRLSPSPGERIATTPTLVVQIGGAELNVAISAAAMGAEATWISSLPEGNPIATQIIRHANSYGVSASIVPRPERVGLYFVEVGPEPRGSVVHYDRANSAFSFLTSEESGFVERTHGADALFSTGISLAVLPDKAHVVQDFFDSRSGALKCFEINYRRKLWDREGALRVMKSIIDQVDILFASSHDLTKLFAFDSDSIRAAQIAVKEFGLSLLCMPARDGSVGSMSTNRMTAVSSDGVVSSECSGRVIDPIGAGDAGTGAFLGEYLSSGDVEMATQISVRASALAQTINGDAAGFSREEILESSKLRIRR
jgi:2-dehydro-3-deoxygluconokinase